MADVRKTGSLVLTALILLSFIAIPLSVYAAESPHLMVVEWSVEQSDARGKKIPTLPPATDDSMTNPDYKLLGFKWTTTANYWINPSNTYGFSDEAVVTAITTSAETWDTATSFQVFSYVGTTTRSAGTYDSYNVVSWGSYQSNVIAVTFIWYTRIGRRIIETDTRLNTVFVWSLSGEDGKMDVLNIMTHEFGHWCGLADLYDGKDFWLTMYGYSTYGEVYKRTLGLGDINGLIAVYGV